MRGTAARQATMLTAVTPDALIPQGHPIRKIKPIVEAALVKLSPLGMWAPRMRSGAAGVWSLLEADRMPCRRRHGRLSAYWA